MQTTVKVAKSTQTAMPEIGRAEKTQYFMTIGEGDDMLTLNVGEKTYTHISKMIEKNVPRETEEKNVKNGKGNMENK